MNFGNLIGNDSCSYLYCNFLASWNLIHVVHNQVYVTEVNENEIYVHSVS